jgi:anthranilate synthase component 1
MQPDRDTFRRLAAQGNLVALTQPLMSDLLTPVQTYRQLVAADDRVAPSFLFESVENGTHIGRHSFLASQPIIEVIARGHAVSIADHRSGDVKSLTHANPLQIPREITAHWHAAPTAHLPGDVTGGGWIGYAGYDTVRYLEPEKLPFADAPPDDRHLPDMHFGLYPQIVVFDHATKMLHAIQHVLVDDFASADAAYDAGAAALESLVDTLRRPRTDLPPGRINLDASAAPSMPDASNYTQTEFEDAVRRIKEYIAAGDTFQTVISQRFERRTTADPFDIYRALRVVNPSPYMIYMQTRDVMLVASSPEILCRVEHGVVTNRPLAGTRKRGGTPEEDATLEADLLADAKERAEHIMLVDLGRNDLGSVCEYGSINLEKVMAVERYSHVMHLSSTITGALRDDLSCWDALQHTLPVGTVSGAPKVRSMQIIDELEPTRRGPYAGGIGGVGFTGNMDIALALRTMVIPVAKRDNGCWTVHLQAGAGVVADSVPVMEFQETVNKAAALGRAIDLAEQVFARSACTE